ncbi:MAG: PIG-L deacetylase family protein [Anaerolineae bacterium]|nr:PIG-L deacetylase family protein [Anaerolineae bacterium]
MNRVLVVSAHPDDETYGVGGTIISHVARGDAVFVLILTDGVTARHNEIEQQKTAAEQACTRLGVTEVCFARLPDQGLDGLPLLDVIRPISGAIREFQPEIVYTHHRGDVNQDHRRVFEATLVAVRPVGQNPVRRVLSYEVPSSTEWGPPCADWVFTPNVFENIAPFLDQKLAALAMYTQTHESEVKPFPHPRSLEAVRIYAQQRGVSVGMLAAEAFMLLRELRI